MTAMSHQPTTPGSLKPGAIGDDADAHGCVLVACMPGPGVASKRLEEEEDQRDQQNVDDKRFDQHETQNQVAPNFTGRARIARDTLNRPAIALDCPSAP